MDSLLWLLVFGGFFYLMMRFGCGAHMVHGGHGSHGGHAHSGDGGTGPDEIAGPAKDPVCGMAVEPGRGYAEAYQGSQYHFCSRNCLDKFDADPQHYIS